MKPLRTVFLGCGWAGSVHMQNLAKTPDRAELIAFCDINPAAAAEMARKFGAAGARTYTDHRQMFARESIDLIVISLPPFAHSDAVDLAAERGVHIFIEKPIALSAEKAWHMVEIVEKAGICTQVGFMYRFGAAIERTRQLLAQDAGRAGLLTARYACNSLHTPWWREKSKSGGQLVEQAIHLADLMRYLLGEPAEVYCVQRNLFHSHLPDYTVEDISATVVQFQSGALGVLTATNGAIPMRWEYSLRLVAQNLTVSFADANHAELTHTGVPQAEQETVQSQADVYALEMLDLLEAIETRRPTRTPMREGARTLELVLAADRSTASGMPVRIESAI